MDYQVNIEVFRGPLDLLLFLVKRNEVDICDIPISRIADQFKEYLAILRSVDVELAGEFLVMAATLMEIKSKMLLPRAEEEADDAADPRLELVKQLIEYKKFRDATALLDNQAEQQGHRHSRVPVAERSGPDPTLQPLRRVELWDLVSAFGRLMRETLATQPQQITLDFTPIHVYMEQIEQRLQRDGSTPFSGIFEPPHNRSRLVGLFLAILELIKGRKVTVEQSEVFADFTVSLARNET